MDRNSLDKQKVMSELLEHNERYQSYQMLKLDSINFIHSKRALMYKEIKGISFCLIFLFLLPLFLITNKIYRPPKAEGRNRIFIPNENCRYRENKEIFIHDAFSEQEFVLWPKIRYLNTRDLIFLTSLIKTFSYKLGIFYLLAKLINSVSLLRPIINQYNPSYICLFNEWDLVSPSIHSYLSNNGIIYEILMHGDKAYELTDSYTSSDKLYIWSKEYEDIFRDLRVKSEFQIIGYPNDFNIKVRGSSEKRIFFIPPIKRNFSLEESKRHQKELISFIQTKNPLIKLHPKYSKEQIKLFSISEYSSFVKDLDLTNNSIMVGYISTLLLKAAISGIDVRVIKSNQTVEMSNYHPLFFFKNVSMINLEDLINL